MTPFIIARVESTSRYGQLNAALVRCETIVGGHSGMTRKVCGLGMSAVVKSPDLPLRRRGVADMTMQPAHQIGRVWLMLSMLLPGPAVAAAGIVVDEDLRTSADIYKVSLGMQKPGRTWDFKFGDYHIVSSKTGVAVTSSTSSFLTNRGESRTRQDYSFVMKGGGSATARVTAVQNAEARDIPDLDLGAGFAIDLEAIEGGIDGLLASILIEGDLNESWTLLLNVKRSWANTVEETRMSLLSNGTRQIRVVPVTSDQPGAKSSSLPARGYEFFDEDMPIAALQYLGAGVLGFNKNVVYLRRDLEPQTRLMLAAAMSAIMQAKINALAE